MCVPPTRVLQHLAHLYLARPRTYDKYDDILVASNYFQMRNGVQMKYGGRSYGTIDKCTFAQLVYMSFEINREKKWE